MTKKYPIKITKKYQSPFPIGAVVVFEPKNFAKNYWDGETEEEKIKYYGPLGYGQEKKKLFVFMCPIYNADGYDSGHCVLMDMDDQHLESMRHSSNFRLATDEEFG